MTPAQRPKPAGRSVPATVVVLAYNSADTIGACLRSLRPQVDDLGAELVVVDNDSSDESASIAERFGAEVVLAEVNLGFAGGCNLGARAGDGDVVVLVNPDSQLDPGALATLAEVARDERRGPVGGRAHHPDGTFDARCVMGRPHLRAALAFACGLDTLARGSWFDPEHGPSDLPEHGVVKVAAVSGAVMAVERSLWEVLGGLDEDFFVYGEDVDLCLRAAAAGRPPAVAAAAGYTHVGGMATDGTTDRRILLHRGKVDLYRRHLRSPWDGVAVACLQVGALARGLPALLPESRATLRAKPWLDLFRRRREWRLGHGAAPRPGIRS